MLSFYVKHRPVQERMYRQGVQAASPCVTDALSECVERKNLLSRLAGHNPDYRDEYINYRFFNCNSIKGLNQIFTIINLARASPILEMLTNNKLHFTHNRTGHVGIISRNINGRMFFDPAEVADNLHLHFSSVAIMIWTVISPE